MDLKNLHADILQKAAQAPSLARVQKIFSQKKKNTSAPQEICITHVAPAAWPFVGAALAFAHKSPGSVWFLSSDVKKQECFFEELRCWLDHVAFFPDLGMTAEGEGLPDPEILSERLAFLGRLAQGDQMASVITAAELSQQVPAQRDLTAGLWNINVGWQGSPGELLQRLCDHHFTRTTSVIARGEVALRGGIVDFFAWQEELPCRVEFDETGIISMRLFHPDTQLSIRSVDCCEIQSAETEKATVPFSQYLQPEDLIFILGDAFKKEEEAIIKKIVASKIRITDHVTAPSEEVSQVIEASFYPIPFAQFGAGDFVMQEAKRKEFFEQLALWQKKSEQILFFSNTEGEGERFAQLLDEDHQLKRSSVEMRHTAITQGFSFPEGKFAVLSHAEIFGSSAYQQARRWHRRREELQAARSAINFSEFEEGDFVVHADYGIGLYQGLQHLPSANGTDEEVLVLEFAEEAKLFVPLDQAWQVSRYVGVGKAVPALSSLQDGRWGKIRAATEKSIFQYAGKLLKLQAERETQHGYAFGPDTVWQQELEQSFPFQETVDQLRAISEIKQDMESPQPMDRLLCGDVGFGKTEVALRAAFKAVMEGKQVIFLAPTTVLAQQHYETLAQRMSQYPVRIELMSRYRTTAEQRKVAKGLADGSVDLVVGTHRLFSSDIIFKDLGLVIVDEEQRFGVKHKETFKERFRLIDMLTLSATPIPRTLYLSLMGARKMSLLETPPSHRQSVETIVGAYDERLIRQACEQELARGGQVYFLHNRVGTIEKTAARLQELLPDAKILIGHGQMQEKELEQVMHNFIGGKADILVSTTIIESGLDIPNANTIIIDRADRFGLADLYQLRGRVGRSHQKAYAYLMLPRSLMMVSEARRRVQAIRQYTALGSGFKIAMRDLEIRGAGNLLGTAQSGHITAIGFDLYCKMLTKAVDQLQGKESQKEFSGKSAAVLLDFVVTTSSSWALEQEKLQEKKKATGNDYYQYLLPAFIPEDYMPEASLRIEGYRHLATALTRTKLRELENHWRDRFGPLPKAVENLLMLEIIRHAAVEHQVTKVETRDNKLMLTRGGDFLLLGHQFPRLTSVAPESKLSEVLKFLDSL